MFPRLLQNRRQPLGLGLSRTVVMRAVSLGDSDARRRCDGDQLEYQSTSKFFVTKLGRDNIIPPPPLPEKWVGQV